MILGTIILYLIIGVIFATICYYMLLSETDLPSKTSETIILMIMCTLLWIILMPIIIYNNIKGGN